MEPSGKDADAKVSDCRECQNLAVALDSRRDENCVRCDQVNDLSSLMEELRDGGERLSQGDGPVEPCSGLPHTGAETRKKQPMSLSHGAEDICDICSLTQNSYNKKFTFK